MSCQKLPMLVPLARHDPADQRDRDRDPDAGRQEVLHGEPGHLAEVAHRRLAGVVLPVRVGHERRGRVEGHVPRRRVELLWVEAREVPQRLRTQDDVQQQPPREREDDHASRIGLPVLTLVGVDPQDPVKQSLRGSEQRVEQRALACVDGGHVATERQRERRQDHHEQRRSSASRGRSWRQNFSPRRSAYSRYAQTSTEAIRPNRSAPLIEATRNVISGRSRRSGRGESRTPRYPLPRQECP